MDKIIDLQVIRGEKANIKPEWLDSYDRGYELGKDHGARLERIKNKNFYRGQGWVMGSLFCGIVMTIAQYVLR